MTRADRYEDLQALGDMDFVAERNKMYAENAVRILMAFKRYGLMRFRGRPSKELQDMAFNAMMDMVTYLTDDRLPISDHFAVVADYNTRFAEKDNRNPEDPHRTELIYTVGLELVIRDCRNYSAMMMDTGPEMMRYLRPTHGGNNPLMKPNISARVLDIPLGMITKVDYKPVTGQLKLDVKGMAGEKYTITFAPGGVEPLLAALYQEYADEMELPFVSTDVKDDELLDIDKPIYTPEDIQEDDDNDR